MDSRILRDPTSGMLVDLSDVPTPDLGNLESALDAMNALEQGAIANSDENRMVGHYWLRDPSRSPSEQHRQAIEACERQIAALSMGPHSALLWIGIGGSALGPQLIHRVLSRPDDVVSVHFLDNIDPDGIAQTLSRLDPAETLVVVASKSGRTVETCSALAATEAWWAHHSEPFAPHTITITAANSVLDKRAQAEGWIASLPLWDWVGGRTSITGSVGQVLMQLCGWDRSAMLCGARDADRWGRTPVAVNPAAQIAALLVQQCRQGTHGLIIQPYSDALSLLSRYLQQLIMESIGKNLNRKGEPVDSGILVLGHKGATDQHALMQQVLDGRADSLCCFLDVARRDTSPTDSKGRPLADHLLGMLEGTREALRQRDRPALLIQLPAADAYGLGLIIALFERVVGIWAELLDINAYHQPAVESGKKAAEETIDLLDRVYASLTAVPQSADEIAHKLRANPRQCWRLLHHLSSTARANTTIGRQASEDRFSNQGD